MMRSILFILFLGLPAITQAIRGERRHRKQASPLDHTPPTNERVWSTRFLQNAEKNNEDKNNDDKDANKDADKDADKEQADREADKNADKDAEKDVEETQTPTQAPTTIPTTIPTATPVAEPPATLPEDEESTPTTSGEDIFDAPATEVELDFSLAFVGGDEDVLALEKVEDTWASHVAWAVNTWTCQQLESTNTNLPRVKGVCYNETTTVADGVVVSETPLVSVVRQGTVDSSWTHWRTIYSVVQNADDATALQSQWQQELNDHMDDWNDVLNQHKTDEDLHTHHDVTLLASPTGQESEFFSPEALNAARSPFLVAEESTDAMRIGGIILFLLTALFYALLVKRSESRRKLLKDADVNYDAKDMFKKSSTPMSGATAMSSPSGQEIVWNNNDNTDFLPPALHATSTNPDQVAVAAALEEQMLSTSSPKSKPRSTVIAAGRVSPLPEPDCGDSFSNLLPSMLSGDEEDDDEYKTPGSMLLSFFSNSTDETIPPEKLNDG